MPNVLWCTQDVNPGYVSSLVNFYPILLISSASLTQYSLANTYQKLTMIPQEATILFSREGPCLLCVPLKLRNLFLPHPRCSLLPATITLLVLCFYAVL